ncbi:LCP family protein [Nocardia vinacea]|uniref:LCP family protein n=1 Tax=Nocardia vinacea TaxID=96468 RepID=UPI00030E0EC3|nr:LCP family protein [Nocardia vinacea]
MSDETEPIPVVVPRSGGRHARHARPDIPAEGVREISAHVAGARRSDRAVDRGEIGRSRAEHEKSSTRDPRAGQANARTVAGAKAVGSGGARSPRAKASDIAERPTEGHWPVVQPNRRTRRAQVPKPPSWQARIARTVVRLAVAATAVVVVSGTGFAYYTEKSLDQGFTHSNAISAEDAAALDGDMNILLIGLDTRKDRNGNDLPKDVMDQLHAGDGSEGGYNANSLILVHIPKDLKKITAFSIPRDDYVAVTGIPGYDHAKIKEAYGLKKVTVEQKLANQGVKDKVELERQGREAGRESIVQTVKALTGVPINRFAEVSLVGFYDLANILGGVDVCLNHAVNDEYYSGAVFPAGPQHLDAANALSFVRQRHELDNGDLDRTHRQQAFLTSVAKQLKDSGTLTNIGKMQQLINAAQNDVVLSQGWNVLDFAQTMGKAGSIPIEFQTLPVQGYQTVDGQDVNVIDPAAIKKTVRTAFGVQAAAPSAPTTTPTSTVDVVNAGGATGMAAKVSTALADRGFQKGTIGNAAYTDGSSSVVYYGTGADTDATQAADLLGGLPTAASKNLDPGHIKIVIGSDFTLPDELSSGTSSSSTTTATGPASPTASSTGAGATPADGAPDSGKPVTTSIGSNIPCVD